MTKREIVERYLHRIGYRRTQGDTFEPVMPVFVLDLMYQLHNEQIAGPAKSFRQQSAFHHNRWMEAYTRFNRRFFDTFTVDEQDEVCDMMDAFEKAMGNHVTIARLAVMDVFPELPTDQRLVLSSISLCNTMCHAAQALYGNVYKIPHRDPTGRIVAGGPKRNEEINAMIRHSIRLMNEYYRSIGGKRTEALASDAVVKTTEVLIRRIFEWLSNIE